ncbi:MAG: ATP-binding protein [Ardenticatenaceae bacterium]
MQPVAELLPHYLSDVEQAAIAQEPIVLQRHAKAMQALLSMSDYQAQGAQLATAPSVAAELLLASQEPKYSQAAFEQHERLYYRIKLMEKAVAYFERLIKHSLHPDAQRIRVAQHIFAVKPYSEDGVEILQEIPANSPYYRQALRWLALNLTPKEYYQMFNRNSEDSVRDTAILNRTIYHRIANEISVLRDIADEIVSDYQDEDEALADIIESIEYLSLGIIERRELEKAKVKAIASHDYDQVIAVISRTAHEISDFVGNGLVIIEEDIRYVLEYWPVKYLFYQELSDLLVEVKATQAALNALKSVNEGIYIERTRFPVKQLFAKWAKNPKIKHATISLDIENEDSEFKGDEEKIKSFLSELVENSLRHNPDLEADAAQANLSIRMTSKDQVNPPRIRGQNIPGEQKYLVITFSDNGRGIPPDKKEWILLPLKTTSKVGSGLGLFIIKRTLTRMNGYIIESGSQGAKFEIYIPYAKGGVN